MIEISVSNKGFITGLTPKQSKAIKELLTVNNPIFGKKLDMDLVPWGIEKYLQYYKIFPGLGIEIPVGAIKSVLPMLKEKNLKNIKLIDNRFSNRKQFPAITFTGKLRNYQKETVDVCLKKTCGTIEAMTGCHSKGTNILLYDGHFKKVEDITTDDIIMGWDSTPRTVLKTINGIGEMYKIIPNKGDNFIVNEDHYLTLKHTVTKTIIDIQVKEFLKLKPKGRSLYKLFKTEIDFITGNKLPIVPYFLGLLLGGGSIINNINITTQDFAIENEIYKNAKTFNCTVRKEKGNNCYTYYFTNNYKHNNKLKAEIAKLGLLGHKADSKFIPYIYKTATKKERLELLAGLLDTDGYMYNNNYDYVSKSKTLANDLAYIARSVGLRATVVPTHKYSQTGRGGKYYRVFISGLTHLIPCKLLHKIAKKTTYNKDPLVTGFKVEYIGLDNYYGFIIDGDHRYVFNDFFVTHNSGKTVTFINLICKIKEPTLILVHTRELLNQTIEKLTQFTTIKKDDVGIIGDGKFTVKPISVGLHQTMSRLTNDKLDKVNRMFGMIIADETHIVAAQTFYATMVNLKAKYKFGFSATPLREDGLTDVIFWATGPHIHKVAQEKLINNIIKPKYKKIVTDYYYPLISTDEYQMMLTDMAENSSRNMLIFETLKDYKGKCICLLCGRTSQVAIFQRKFGKKAVSITSKTAKKLRVERMNMIKDGRVDIIISTINLFSTGIDIPRLEILALCSPFKSKVLVPQCAGRLTRPYPGITEKWIIDFVDNNVELLRIQSYQRKRILNQVIQNGGNKS